MGFKFSEVCNYNLLNGCCDASVFEPSLPLYYAQAMLKMYRGSKTIQKTILFCI